jgi:hypothetical protein
MVSDFLIGQKPGAFIQQLLLTIFFLPRVQSPRKKKILKLRAFARSQALDRYDVGDQTANLVLISSKANNLGVVAEYHSL